MTSVEPTAQVTNMEDEEDNSFVAFFIGFILCLIFPPAILMIPKVINQYERAIVMRMGRASKKIKGPGLIGVIPCLDEIKTVDMRTVSWDVPPQNILSKDSLSITVDAVVYFRVKNPYFAVINVDDYYQTTSLLAQTTLRNTLSNKTLKEMLAQKDEIAAEIKSILDESTEQWGIEVLRMEMKNMRLPPDLQRTMASEAEAERKSKARVISAEGEARVSRILSDAGKLLSESPAAVQFRYLQTLSDVSRNENRTLIMPIPKSLLKKFVNKFRPRPQSKQILEDYI